MICSHCGASVNEGAAFCQNCGQPVAAQPEAPRYEQPAQEPVQQPQYQQNAYQNQYQNPYQNQYQQPYQNPYQQGSPVKSGAYLAWSIVVTVLCCWPFGIPAIVNAARINSCNDRGDFAGAQQAAKKSKTWTIVSACVGVVLGILAGILGAVGALSY